MQSVGIIICWLTTNKVFTANYVNADSNFRIFNLKSGKSLSKYHSVICVVLNLLQRGTPTYISAYLKTLYNFESSNEKLHLVTDKVPNWGSVIKGNDDNGFYPARVFYYQIIPEYFSEYPLESAVVSHPTQDRRY